MSKGWFGGYQARMAANDQNPNSQDAVSRRHPGQLPAHKIGQPAQIPGLAQGQQHQAGGTLVNSQVKMGSLSQNSTITVRPSPTRDTLNKMIEMMKIELSPLHGLGEMLGIVWIWKSGFSLTSRQTDPCWTC
jgi:hypothetical protein